MNADYVTDAGCVADAGYVMKAGCGSEPVPLLTKTVNAVGQAGWNWRAIGILCPNLFSQHIYE